MRAGLAAVGTGKGFYHQGIAKFGKLFGKAHLVKLLAQMEARIFKQHGLTGANFRHGLRGNAADAIGDKRNLLTKHLR